MSSDSTVPATALAGVRPHIEALSDRFIALANDIWDHPELRWEEHYSSAAQIAAATALGARITREIGDIPTAFTAEWGQGGPVLAFLGEFDALDNLSQKAGAVTREPNPDSSATCGHGCGHNLLGSGSLLAAAALARALEEKGLPGTVRYYGCPAEEAAAGKTFMVAAGAFDDVAAAISWHPGDGLTTSQNLMLAYTQVVFRFKGVASHAGAAPQHGRSALDAAELMNVGVNFLREHMDDADRIHYAFLDAGGASANMVQPTAALYYIIRSPKVASMRALYERVVKVAEGAAHMTETELEVDFEGACAEILPNRALEEFLHATMCELGGIPFDDADQAFGRLIEQSLPVGAAAKGRAMRGLSPDALPYYTGVEPLVDPARRTQLTGSSDVGDVSWVVPTVQVMGGTLVLGTPFHSWQVVAQGKSTPAHKGMVHVATALAATGLGLMLAPDVLAAARKEFDDVIAVTPYDNPLPEGLVAPPARPGYQPA